MGIKSSFLWAIFALFCPFVLLSQTPQDTIAPATEEEDYSQYDNLGFADEGARRYCSPKIFGLSPQRFVSVAWDMQLAHDARFSTIGAYDEGDNPPIEQSGRVRSASGLRLGANIPVVSRNSILWQMGANFANTNYDIRDIRWVPADNNGIAQMLDRSGLRTAGLNTTVFKPLGEHQFLLFQGSADLSGDYTFSDIQSLRYLRYSAAAIWGKRPHDRKQWGVGIARTYRVGEMNYIPVVLFNWTSVNRKWGSEVLFPARAHMRYTVNPRQLLLAGYELEGQSYRLNTLSPNDRSLEIRRGELRARVEYQRHLFHFVWLSVQGGWRYNWSYNADYLDDGQEFFRGFTGNQKYAMLNELTNPLYFNVGIHLVSP